VGRTLGVCTILSKGADLQPGNGTFFWFNLRIYFVFLLGLSSDGVAAAVPHSLDLTLEQPSGRTPPDFQGRPSL